MFTTKRCWFQFSLRTLLITVTLSSAGFSWLGQKVWQAQRQKEAAETVRKAGGFVAFDYQRDSDGDYNDTAKPPAPAWLRNLLGEDLFANVTVVFLCGAKLTDEKLADLEGMPKLESLNICYTKITDDGLANLRALKKLRELRASHTQLTDAGLVHLKGLSELRRLDVSTTKISDVGLLQLCELRELEHLDVDQTQVSDAGFEKLREVLPKLEKRE